MCSRGEHSAALVSKAKDYLDRLCLPYPDRRVGGPGGSAANRVFADTVATFGWSVTSTEFPCIVWLPGQGSSLRVGAETLSLHAGPYSLPLEVEAPLSAVDSVESLEQAQVAGHILLLHGDLVREQLAPKNYPFYRWESHTRIISAIEQAEPAAVIAATGRSTELVGSLYPFPLIEDADFDIPHAFITDVAGDALLSRVGEVASVFIDSGRQSSVAEQVVARLGDPQHRIVVSGHIDSRRGSPGAIDNASGVVVLLLLAELLAEWRGECGVELVPFNGEDDYAAPGEMTYLAANGTGLKQEVVLNVNVDGVGWKGHKAEVSRYECPEDVTAVVTEVLAGRDLVVEGSPWPQSDHMVFVMRGIPAVALTTADATGLRDRIAHTVADVPAEVDPAVLVAVAEYVAPLIERLAAV